MTRAYGDTYADEIARTLDTYERLFAAVAREPVDLDRAGTAALEQTAAFAPALADEIAEIARGAALPIEQVAALNARTEILAASHAPVAGECSALVVLDGADGPLAIQTWDWHTVLADCWHVRTIEHPDGRVVRTMTEYGIVGKIGVSSAGIGTLFTILHHRRDGGPAGVPVHVVARRILDEATDVDDAVAIAEEASVSASTSITVVSTAGEEPRAASIELYPGGPARVDPDRNGVLAHTNHFLARGPAAADTGADADSIGRLARLRRGLEGRPCPGLATALELLSAHDDGAALCCHPEPHAVLGEHYATLATVSLDVPCGTLTAFEGGPCAIREPVGPLADSPTPA
jgi:isopenicillin-N N-acyltransferase-like protein